MENHFRKLKQPFLMPKLIESTYQYVLIIYIGSHLKCHVGIMIYKLTTLISKVHVPLQVEYLHLLEVICIKIYNFVKIL